MSSFVKQRKQLRSRKWKYRIKRGLHPLVEVFDTSDFFFHCCYAIFHPSMIKDKHYFHSLKRDSSTASRCTSLHSSSDSFLSLIHTKHVQRIISSQRSKVQLCLLFIVSGLLHSLLFSDSLEESWKYLLL